MQSIEQSVLNHAVLDDMPEHFGMDTGRREMDLPGAAAIPDVHVGVRTTAPADNAIPDAQAFKYSLAGRRQGTHSRFERSLPIEGFDAQGATVQQQDFEPTVL